MVAACLVFGIQPARAEEPTTTTEATTTTESTTTTEPTTTTTAPEPEAPAIDRVTGYDVQVLVVLGALTAGAVFARNAWGRS